MVILHYIEGRCAADTANGVDKVVYFLSSAQGHLGHEVHVMCESDKAVLPVPGVQVVNTPRMRSCFRLSKHARDTVNGIKPDLIHLHSAYIPTGISLARYARSQGIPYIISPHGNYSGELGRRRRLLKWFYKRFFELPCAEGAAWVHGMGDDQSIRDFGYEGIVHTIPNGFEMKTCLPDKPGNQVVLRRLPQLEGKRVILFIGRLDFEQKGLDLLLKAYAGCDHGNSYLIIVGPTWKDGLGKVQKLMGELGLGDDRLCLWGPAFGEEKAALLHSADIFIHTSRWEGFPMAVIEAMAYQKACVVTRPADPQGILESRHLGFVCGPDEAEIATVLGDALGRTDQELGELGEAAAEVVKTEYSWEHVAKEMVGRYLENAEKR